MQTQQARSVEYTEFSDGVLVKQALIGHQEAFETLVHRYSTSLFNFIYHFLGDYDHACDILQQVFLQLFLSLSIIQTDEPIKPCLFQVATAVWMSFVNRIEGLPFTFLKLSQFRMKVNF